MPPSREPVKSRGEGEGLGQRGARKEACLVLSQAWGRRVGIRRAGQRKLYLEAFSRREAREVLRACQ